MTLDNPLLVAYASGSVVLVLSVSSYLLGSLDAPHPVRDRTVMAISGVVVVATAIALFRRCP
jgi:hypothetical protein